MRVKVDSWMLRSEEEKGRRDRRREGVLSDEFRRQVATITVSPNVVFKLNCRTEKV